MMQITQTTAANGRQKYRLLATRLLILLAIQVGWTTRNQVQCNQQNGKQVARFSSQSHQHHQPFRWHQQDSTFLLEPGKLSNGNSNQKEADQLQEPRIFQEAGSKFAASDHNEESKFSSSRDDKETLNLPAGKCDCVSLF